MIEDVTTTATRDPITGTTTARRWAAAGAAGTVLCLLAVLAMHLVAPWSRRDPVRRTISEYAVGAGGWAFDAAVLVLVASSVAITVALVRARVVPGRSAAVALLAVWCAGLALVVVFEKTNWSIGPSLSGTIHRYASLAAFLALPAAGLRVARWPVPGRRWLRGLSWTAYACFVPIVVAIASRPFTGVPWFRAVPLGLLERGVALAEVAVVLLLALAASRGRLAATTHPPGGGRT